MCERAERTALDKKVLARQIGSSLNPSPAQATRCWGRTPAGVRSRKPTHSRLSGLSCPRENYKSQSARRGLGHVGGRQARLNSLRQPFVGRESCSAASSFASSHPLPPLPPPPPSPLPAPPGFRRRRHRSSRIPAQILRLHVLPFFFTTAS